MTRNINSDDHANYGEQQTRYKRIKWSLCKVVFTFFLFVVSLILIILGFVPLFEYGIDAKNLANLLFVGLHIFYLMSFNGVKREKQYYFWISSLLLLDFTTLMFYFYENIFF